MTHQAHSVPETGAKVRDPVCGMMVDPARTPHHAEHDGAVYHFCGARCLEKFKANPTKYLGQADQAHYTHHAHAAPAGPPLAKGAIYTCPMHPQIRNVGPGTCPICGMALEPLDVGTGGDNNSDLEDMTRRLCIGSLLTIPILALDMGGHFGLIKDLIPADSARWIEFALTTPVTLIIGAPFLARGAASLRSGHLNMFTLIALGVLAAYTYSTAALLFPSIFPSAARDAHGMVPLYYESAAVITVLVALG